MSIGGCSAPPEPFDESIATTTDALIGVDPPSQIQAFPFVNATGRIFGNGTTCSATLVGTDRVLTAGHCFCDLPTTGWTFRGFAAHEPSTEGAGYGDWAVAAITRFGGCEESTGYDIAVARLAPNAAGATWPTLSGIPAAAVSLDNPERVAAGHLAGQAWAVGFGRAYQDDWDSPNACLNCNIRAACEIAPYGGLASPIRISGQHQGPTNSGARDLARVWYDDFRQWWSWGIPDGAYCETTKGDSGGGLFLNVNRAGVTPVLVGVASWGKSGDYQNWQSTGDPDLADQLWAAMDLPYTRKWTTERSTTGIYATSFVKLNDRANVGPTTSVAGLVTPPPKVVAGSYVAMGVQSRVHGDVSTRGYINANQDAVVTGTASAWGTIAPSVSAGTKKPGVHQKYEPLDLQIPWASSAGDAISYPRAPMLIVAPGSYRSMTVYGFSRTMLYSGVYVVNDLTLESNSDLIVDTTNGPVWLYVKGNLIARGAISADPAKFLVGHIPGANASRWVHIGNEWRGTFFGPQSDVVVDMVENAVARGAFFAHSYEQHQGRFFFFNPFLHSLVPTCVDGFEDCL